MRLTAQGRLRTALVIVGACAALWAVTARSDVQIAGTERAAAGSPGSVSVQVTASSAGKVKPPASGAYIGVFKPPAPWDMSALTDYDEQASDKKPAILAWYQSWHPGPQYSSSFMTDKTLATFAQGAIPLITWEPGKPGVGPTQSAYQLRDINAGTYDAYIRSWARAIKAVRGPVMLRPMHEMNGSWYPWCGSVNGNSPKQFRAAWRRIHRIFREEKTTNVTWVWSINCASFPNTYANRYAAYYPGDAYVDWTSISGYNWGTSRPGLRWLSFDTIYAKPLAYLRSVGKPIVITEIGSVPNGGNKPAWIKNTYRSIELNHRLVKGIVYFDKRDVRSDSVQDWRITSDLRSARAYRRAVADPYYLAGPATTLKAWQAAAAP